MSDDILIYRFHVDAQANTVVVEFRMKNADGRYEPPVGYARHTIPITAEFTTSLADQLLPTLTADLAQLPPQMLRSHAVTSELHALRETRLEHEQTVASIEKAKQQQAAEQATHLQEIERLISIRREHESAVATIEKGKGVAGRT